MNEKFLSYVKELLHNTYSSESQIHQSEIELKELCENEPNFADVILYIILNDTDVSIRKAAIIQTRYFSPEDILKLFVLFNEKLDPYFHQMLTFLSDLLANRYTDILYEFCVCEESNQSKEFTEDDIIHEKTLMIGFLSLINHIDIQIQEDLRSAFLNNLLQHILFINEILQSNVESQTSNLTEQHILYFNYFLQVFCKYFGFYLANMIYSNIFQEEALNILEFVHNFLCFSLTINIDSIFQNLNTKIVDTLLYFHSLYFEADESLQQSIKFDEIMESFQIFSQSISIENCPLSFMINIKSFFDSEIVFPKYQDITEKIIINYIYPIFSYSFYTNITDDVEFVDLYYPNPNSGYLLGYTMEILICSGKNKYLHDLLYEFASYQLHESITKNQSEEIFSVFNMMSNCSFSNLPNQAKYLFEFFNFINDELLHSEDPLIIISIMHYISELPQRIEYIPPDFIEFIVSGLNNEIEISEDSAIDYSNIIQYFSILAYTNFISREEFSFLNEDSDKVREILDITINLNEYFKTENISLALSNVIDYLGEIDDELLDQLIEIIWQIFNEDPTSKSSANSLASFESVLKKCTDEQKQNAADTILNLFSEFLNSSSNSDEDRNNVFSTLFYLSEDFFCFIGCIVTYLIHILPDDQFNDLFIRIRDIYFISFSIINEDDFGWGVIDLSLMHFVNLKGKIDHTLLLEFFEFLIRTIIEREWKPDNLNSLKAFLLNFSEFDDVKAFENTYNEEITFILQNNNGNEEEEEEEYKEN